MFYDESVFKILAKQQRCEQNKPGARCDNLIELFKMPNQSVLHWPNTIFFPVLLRKTKTLMELAAARKEPGEAPALNSLYFESSKLPSCV